MKMYEQLLDSDARWAMREGSSHFEGKSAVQETLRRISQRLESLGVSYAVAGGMALLAHGFRRFTEVTEILVTREGLTAIHERLSGLGYCPKFVGSKNLRDTESGVSIEFLIAGEFPGDGKKKPVAFPEPDEVGTVVDGIRYLNLETLVQLKLASGMTGAGRLKDLADVQQLIGLLNLPREFRKRLDPYVQGKYDELWLSGRKRYVRLWQYDASLGTPATMQDLIALDPENASTIEAMRDDGILLDPDAGADAGVAYLLTLDPEIAAKYEMQDETDLSTTPA